MPPPPPAARLAPGARPRVPRIAPRTGGRRGRPWPGRGKGRARASGPRGYVIRPRGAPMVPPAAPKLEAREASGGERAPAAESAPGRRGGAGPGLRGGAGGLPRPRPRPDGAWGRGPSPRRGPSHSKDPNLPRESRPRGGAPGAARGHAVRARACAFLLFCRDPGVCASPGRHPPTPHLAGETPRPGRGGLAQQRPRWDEEGAEPRPPRCPGAFFLQIPVHSACRGPPLGLTVARG